MHQLLDEVPYRLYPGHGPHIEEGNDLLTRYAAHRFSREGQIVELLEEHWRERSGEKEDNIVEGTTALQIAAALYLDTPLDKLRQAKENVEKVLVKLWKENRLKYCAADGSNTVRMNKAYSGPVNLPEDVLWTPLARFYEHAVLVAAGTGAPGGIGTIASDDGGGDSGGGGGAESAKL